MKLYTKVGLYVSLTATLLYGATIQELQNREQEASKILTEYWIDKVGDVRVGNKESKELQFTFPEDLLNRMTVDQIRKSMTSAIAKFTQEQRDAFTSAVDPYLNELNTVKTELKQERKKLDDAVATLAQYLGKTQDKIMTLPEQNIKNLISVLPQDKKVQLNNTTALRDLIALRPAFNIKVVEPLSAGGTGAETVEKTKVAGIKAKAAAVAATQSNFKISSMVGFVGEATKYGTCRDRHYDIVLDGQGHHFISEAR